MIYRLRKARAVLKDGRYAAIEKIGDMQLPIDCHSLQEVERVRRMAMEPGVERAYFTFDEVEDGRDYDT